MPAGQQTATQRVVDDRGEAGDGGELGVLVLDPPCQQVVELLRGDRARRTDRVGDMVEFGNLPGRVVLDPECTDLSLGDEFGHRREGFGERRRAVGLMQVEQFDMIGLQPRQAAFDTGAQPGRRQR
jgi:hypothetical protein